MKKQKKKVAKKKRSKPKLSVVTAAPPEPQTKPHFIFGIEHEGKALWAVNMYEVHYGQIVDQTKIVSGEFARNAVRRMGQAAMQIAINGYDPQKLKQTQPMPSINAQK